MKRKIIRVLVVLSFVFMLTALLSVSASAETYGDLTYTISDGEVTITDCNDTAASVTIPSTINGYPVTSIDSYAFYGCTSLTSVYISDIAAWCNIDFQYFFDYGDFGCYSNPLVYAGNLYLNGKLVTDLVIPKGVTKINACSFYGCKSITSVSIPPSVTSIGAAALECSSLSSVYITDIAAWCNISFGYNRQYYDRQDHHDYYDAEYHYYNYPIPMRASLYLNGDLITDLIIPDGVANIKPLAFYNCRSLKSITIPDSVTSIGTNAFYYCTNLTSVTIPDSVTSIGERAFYYCTSLTTATIGDGVRDIGDEAFKACSSLTSMTIPDSVTSIGNQALSQCYSLKNVIIGDCVTSIGYYAFSSCTSLETIYIPSLSIYRHAFDGCKNLKSVTFGNSTIIIEECVFYNCTSLENITIPDNVTSFHIGDDAFLGCTNLKYNTYDNGNYLGNSYNPYIYLANNVSDTITTCIIHSDTKIIGRSAFEGCTSLTSVTIPDSVTSIGSSAFRNCTSLSTVYYCGTLSQWNTISKGSYNTPLTNATRYYHKIETPTLTTPAGCTSAGMEEGICEICSKYVTREITALGHDEITHEAKTPTCTEIGWNEYVTCSRCDMSTYTELPALGHRVVVSEDSWVDSITVKNDSKYPFSYSNGTYSSTNKSHSSSSTYTITALYDCTLKLEYSVSSEQSYDKLIIKKNSTALYTLSGSVSWTSVDISLKAGDVLTVSYTKDGSVSSNSDTGYFKFSCSQTQISSMVEHPADECEPTCTEAVVCSYCSKTVKEALGHENVQDAKAPTCTEIGWDAYVTCSRCGMNTYSELPALGHDELTHESKAPTCTDVGWDAYVTCSRCDHSTYNELPALGHDWSEWSILVAHSCTSSGLERRTCSVCGTRENKVIAPAHSWGEWETDIEPTCTEAGTNIRECTVCSATETSVTPSLGHDEITHDAQAPTCTGIGWDAYVTCSRCDYSTYNELPSLGHDDVQYAGQAPTCTETGWDAYSVCARCERSTYTELPALGHDEIQHDAQAATCTEIGWDAYVTCSRCDHSTYNELPALGHNDTQYEGQAPTCTVAGWADYVICSICDRSTYSEIPALGHSYDKWEMLVEPTENSDGFRSKVCGVCNDEQFEIVLFASGDIDGDGTLTNSDMTLAIRALAGFDTENAMRLDTNYDGVITNRDIIAFIQKLAGWTE